MLKPLLLCLLALLPGVSTQLIASEEQKTTPSLAAPTARDFKLESKPRWEVGVGGAYVDGFDYPASNNPNRRGLALPFVIYRSSRVRFAGRGVSAVAIERDNIKLDFSLAGSLNAESEGNGLRENMPDLDFLLEIGPQLIWRLVDQPYKDGRIKLSWSNRLRAVFSTDFKSLDSRGWVLQSQLQWVHRRLFTPKLDAVAFTNVSWAGEKLHDYFYQVDSEFETATRPRYNARGGYLGSTSFFGVAYRAFPSFRLFGGVRLGYYKGSANEDSPLYETDSNAGIAVGFAWTAYRSKEQIAVLEED